MTWIFAGFLCFFAFVLAAFVIDWLLDLCGIQERWARAKKRRSERVLIDEESTTGLPVHRQNTGDTQDGLVSEKPKKLRINAGPQSFESTDVLLERKFTFKVQTASCKMLSLVCLETKEQYRYAPAEKRIMLA
ncbi:hypothetical protein BDY19DRAFT_906906 [Irpex rosettiformis]|uniref:Uncharacterized protein n=1 Tax=Irpex rosettiformis TaxID=378272 RepID=A0ACB8U2I1_9APHY|nr:hypothetical protein BDY19DRAFT_906906 [Irpex rosettiformis]